VSPDKNQKTGPFKKRDEESPEGARRWYVRPFFVGLATGVFVLLLLTTLLRTSLPTYEVGQIASADIVVPMDLTVEDLQTTEKRKADTLEQVPPVFDYDQSDYTRLLRSVREAFQFGRREGAGLTAEQLRTELLARYQLGLSPELVQELREHEFSTRIEALLTDIVLEQYGQPIVSARVLAARGRNRDLIVRDIRTHEERRVQGKDVANDEALLRGIEKIVAQSPQLTGPQKRACALMAAEILQPNLRLNSYETEERERMAVAQVEPVFYQLRRGRTIVRKGDEITADKMAAILTVQEAMSRQRGLAAAVLGVAILLASIISSLYYYLRMFYRRGKKSPAETFVIMCLVMAISVLAYKLMYSLANLVSGTTSLTFLQAPSNFYYAIPFPLGALLMTLLLDGQAALVFSFFNAMVVGLLFGGDFYVVFYGLLGSLAAIYGTTHYKERSAIYRTGAAISVVCAFFALMLQLVMKTTPEPETYLFITGMSLLCGLLVAILTSFLLPMFESLFNFITDIKLLELANLNLPILRQLMLDAPGTYHHSILIGSLAEAGAEAIGLNPLFMRTAAYYHDIGKIKMAEYFVENQRGENPHDRLNPSMSALIISNHVKEGLETAARIKLPKPIADCIPQHHGTRLMTYFYSKAKEKQDPEMDPVKEDDYRYTGPKPQTKEAAILMLADAVEASARTLEDPSPGKLKNVIKKMVDTIIADGQLDECDINLKELDRMSHAFLRVLLGIYHRRVSYPGFDFEAKKPKNGKA